MYKAAECTNVDMTNTCNEVTYFDQFPIPETDPYYIARDATYKTKISPSQYKGVDALQASYRPEMINRDRRVAYANAKSETLAAAHAWKCMHETA